MLLVNQLIGFAAGPESLTGGTFGTVSQDSTDTATYSIAAVSYNGAASSDRICVVAIVTRANAARSISSVTIGGVTATHIVTANNTSGGADIVSLWAANVPTGTSGTVAVNTSAAMLRCMVSVASLYGLSSLLPFATATDLTLTGSDLSASIAVASGGVVLAAVSNDGTSASCTWSGVTEDVDTQSGETTSNGISAGHLKSTTSQTVTVTATLATGPTNPGLAVAAWNP